MRRVKKFLILFVLAMPMISTQSAGTVILILAAIGVIIAFQLWLVGAVLLLILAALALHESAEDARLEKVESRVSLVQVCGAEFQERAEKSLGGLSDSMNFLRGEFKHLAAAVENRISAMEQHALDAQKYFELVEKVIELENRVSALANKEKESAQF